MAILTLFRTALHRGSFAIGGLAPTSCRSFCYREIVGIRLFDLFCFAIAHFYSPETFYRNHDVGYVNDRIETLLERSFISTTQNLILSETSPYNLSASVYSKL